MSFFTLLSHSGHQASLSITNSCAGTSRQCEQVLTAAARKPEKKPEKKNGVERAEMLFRQVSNFIE